MQIKKNKPLRSSFYGIFLALPLGIGLAESALAADLNRLSYDFCTDRRPVTASLTAPQPLNAAEVAEWTRAAAASPSIKDTPWQAYPVAYVAMTAERDRERCSGMLRIGDRPSRLIGDRLADLMTRWLGLAVVHCREAGARTSRYGLCASMARSHEQGLGSLESALDMTAVYLSSHMGGALLAVIYDDRFWNQEFPVDTHCSDTPCGAKVIARRAEYVRRYKPAYDLNNAFLAKNLDTVMNSLKRACLIRGTLATTGARVAEHFPLAPLFGKIRDEAFQGALDSIALVAPQDHPMIVEDGAEAGLGFRAYTPPLFTADSFRDWDEVPEPLAKAERTARGLLTNSLVRAGLGLAGSRSWDDLESFPPSSGQGRSSDRLLGSSSCDAGAL